MKSLKYSLALAASLLGSQALAQAAPTTSADAYEASEDETLSISAAAGVLDNDTAPGTLTATLESNVSNGSLTLNTDGSFSYTPDPNFHGTDSFTYRAIETPTGGQVFTVNQSASSATIDATVTASVSGITLRSSDSDTSQLQGTLNAILTPTSSPFSEIHITDFQVSNSDSVALSFPFRIIIEVARIGVTAQPGGISIAMVQPSPASPVDAGGNFSQLQNVTRGTGTVYVTASGQAAGQVPDGEQVFDADDVLVDLAGTITQSGNTLTLTTPFNFVGVFDIDGGGSISLDIDGTLVATSPVQTAEISAPATVTITVAPVNDPPSITDDQYSVAANANTTLTVPATPDGLLANDSDIDGDTLTASVHSEPANGSLTLSPDGSFTYMPNPGFAGTDSFIYEAQDVDDFVGRALIPFGDDWKYLDNGSDQGTTWRAPAFDDSSWASGPGELGYGEAPGDQATELSYGLGATNKYPTTYFRNHFFIGNVALLPDDVELRLVRDDAAAIYVNGIEIYRDSNLVAGALFNTFASSAVANENEIVTANVPLSALVAGRNTIAVEVHQSSATSSDLAFHLALSCETPAESPIVPLGSVWKYEDSGSDLGSAWASPAFDDSAWLSGAGNLGYGNGGETTELPTPADPKPLTVYFRHAFNLPDASQVQTLAVDLVRDDGAAVYINGTEILRDNLAAGAAFDTPAFATADGESETRVRPFNKVDPTLLQDGENIIAVEVHQSSATSSDLNFDLRVRASLIKSLGLATIDVIGTPFIDTDNDGMDDNWENANGLIVGTDDSILDADGDGRSNLAEFLALTNPQDPASLLKINSVSQAASTALTVDFTSTPGKTYQLQHSPDLAGFTDVPGAALTATGAASSLTTTSPAVTRGYLRVVVQ